MTALRQEAHFGILQATAQTLAAIVMLESASLSTVLTSLLQARSNSLSEILHNHGQRIEGAREVEQVQSDLVRVLDLVLHTVEAAEQIFGTTPDRQPAGLLVQLLQEIEKPTGSHAGVALPQLAPPLCSLPNYSLLSRHLPASILEFRPFLSVSTSQNVLSPTDAQTKIREWALTESNRVVEEVTTWIKSLSGGARTLSLVRDTIKKCLEKKATLTTQSLQAQLEQMIEARLETVYRAQLTALVECVTPCLESLLRELPKSDADLSTAYLLFESPLSFPPTQHYALSAARHGKGANAGDPFDGFLKEVRKRVQGRSPLLERGVGEIEGQARQLRVDLQDWVGDEVTTKSTNDENAAQLRLRQLYLTSAQETLTGIHAAVSRVLKSVSRGASSGKSGTYAQTDVSQHLQISMLHCSSVISLSCCLQVRPSRATYCLAQTPSRKPQVSACEQLLVRVKNDFRRSGTDSYCSHSVESTLVATWRKRIAELQAQTLVTWRVHAVDRSINKIKDSMNVAAASSPAAMLWAWDGRCTFARHVVFTASDLTCLAFESSKCDIERWHQDCVRAFANSTVSSDLVFAAYTCRRSATSGVASHSTRSYDRSLTPASIRSRVRAHRARFCRRARSAEPRRHATTWSGCASGMGRGILIASMGSRCAEPGELATIAG